ncbi:WG repeat-containing protein [Confluentibacter citreus]|uniref:WG repeat-containing protein n=1 Tax=Confluentibacter citreus TaxID=2007307 RepID=UPI000C292A30|nr:WG repeat-containing protein [Confluentibacter citreus]
MENLDFGKKLIEVRKQKGLTQADVAEKCNVTIRTIQRIESGSVKPRSSTIKIISKALEFDFFETSTQNSKLKSNTLLWYAKDLFNFKTNTMKKISILTACLLLFAFTFSNLFSSKAQSANPENEQKTENQSFDRLIFRDGFLIIMKNDKYGLYNSKSKVIIPCEYDKLEIEGNYAITFKDNKRGLIDKNLNTIIPCEYGKFQIEGHLIFTYKNNKQGLTNLDGKVIIPCEYDRFQVTENNFVFTSKNNKHGLMNLDGETIIPCEYHKFQVENNFVFVSKYNKNGLMNLDGETIIPCEYDSIKINGSIAIVTKNGKTENIQI